MALHEFIVFLLEVGNNKNLFDWEYPWHGKWLSIFNVFSLAFRLTFYYNNSQCVCSTKKIKGNKKKKSFVKEIKRNKNIFFLYLFGSFDDHHQSIVSIVNVLIYCKYRLFIAWLVCVHWKYICFFFLIFHLLSIYLIVVNKSIHRETKNHWNKKFVCEYDHTKNRFSAFYIRFE